MSRITLRTCQGKDGEEKTFHVFDVPANSDTDILLDVDFDGLPIVSKIESTRDEQVGRAVSDMIARIAKLQTDIACITAQLTIAQNTIDAFLQAIE